MHCIRQLVGLEHRENTVPLLRLLSWHYGGWILLRQANLPVLQKAQWSWQTAAPENETPDQLSDCASQKRSRVSEKESLEVLQPSLQLRAGILSTLDQTGCSFANWVSKITQGWRKPPVPATSLIIYVGVADPNLFFPNVQSEPPRLPLSASDP